VANMTRQDGRDFLRIAEQIALTPSVETFPLEQANQALQAIASDATDSSAVLLP
jgi:propanol-preferring alcohol dehydrogenase